MKVEDFIAKWAVGGPAYTLNERAGAQTHFIDLCHMLGVPAPDDPDRYCFERGIKKTGGSRGYADVWLRNCFAWEYKAPGKNLDSALRQLMMYALPLENPPLLVVSDRLKIEIHTHFTGTPSEKHVILLEELGRPEQREKLRWLFDSPERFKPAKTNKQITEDAARTFAATAERMRASGAKPETVSHFLTQCLFCFFAEDVHLLPARLFERLVSLHATADAMRQQLTSLFKLMQVGGLFGAEQISWFNGGLFEVVDVPPLSAEDVGALQTASAMNWSAIDPSIFGTLFERGLDPSKRSQLGAHYTDPQTIMRLVEPVVRTPLLAEWGRRADEIGKLLQKRDALHDQAKTVPDKVKYARLRTAANEAGKEAQATFNTFLERLKDFRVLDPSCGSGNFLYLSLKALKDVEHAVNLEAESLGLQRQVDVTGPHNVLGIELNEYAAELARVTVWIGELQWRIQHGYPFRTNPVLEPLDCIENRDAVLNRDGTAATWPRASVIVGNPPFVGNKKMLKELGNEYTRALRRAYPDVPGSVDLVCYWFFKAGESLRHGLGAAGLVSTQSIRHGTNRSVLDRITEVCRIYEAWPDERWWDKGAAVRVAMICFGHSNQSARLAGMEVPTITADLKGFEAFDLTEARPLDENKGRAFQGPVKVGPFDVPGRIVRRWLKEPNPSGRSNAEVLKPLANGDEITGRPADFWIIDFGTMSLEEAQLFAAPFAHVQQFVLPKRLKQSDEGRKRYWWRHGRAGTQYRTALVGLDRYIATSRVSKHRFFVWMPARVWPDSRLFAITVDDDFTFGVLSSRMHTEWSLATASMHGVGNDPTYNAEACFETFPFPSATTHLRDKIAEIARELDRARAAWANPPEWVDTVSEVVPIGLASTPYPSRYVAKPEFAAEVATRTLTNLYNSPPAWLAQLHSRLDAAVAEAFGWDDYSFATPSETIVQRLLVLNQARAETSTVE